MASNAQEQAKQEELNEVERQLTNKNLSQTERNVLLQKKMNALEYFTDRDMNAKAAQQQTTAQEMSPQNADEKKIEKVEGVDLDFTQPGAMPSIPGIEVSEVEMAPGDFSQQGDKLEDIKGRLLKMKALLENANPITKPIIEERVKVLEATHSKLTEGEENTAPSTPSLNTTFVDTSDPNAFDNDDGVRNVQKRTMQSDNLRKSLGIE